MHLLLGPAMHTLKRFSVLNGSSRILVGTTVMYVHVLGRRVSPNVNHANPGVRYTSEGKGPYQQGPITRTG